MEQVVDPRYQFSVFHMTDLSAQATKFPSSPKNSTDNSSERHYSHYPRILDNPPRSSCRKSTYYLLNSVSPAAVRIHADSNSGAVPGTGNYTYRAANAESAATDVTRPYWRVQGSEEEGAFRYDWGGCGRSVIVERRYRGIDPETDLDRARRRGPCDTVRWGRMSWGSAARRAIPGVWARRQHTATVDAEVREEEEEGDCGVTYRSCLV